MLTSNSLAASAVQPICPHCGRPVRSSVQLSAELADLATRLAAAYAPLSAAPSAAAEALYCRTRAEVEASLAGLEAELAGAHFHCTPSVRH